MAMCSCGKEFSTSPSMAAHQRRTGHPLAPHHQAVHLSLSESSTPDISLPQPSKSKNPAKKSLACTLCDRSFPSSNALKDHCSVLHSHKCGACAKVFITFKALQIHNRSTKHCFCRPCKQFFSNSEQLDVHLQSVVHAADFHCCDCDRNFKTQQALDQHLQFKDHTSVRNKNHECEECDRTFLNQAALDTHRASLVHKPLSHIKCIGSSKCKPWFNSPSAMIQHLESGKCHSGMTRKRLNQLVQGSDIDFMTSSGQEEQDLLAELDNRLSSLTLTSKPIYTPNQSKASTPIMTPTTDDGSGVRLSPYLGAISPVLSVADLSTIQAQPNSYDSIIVRKAGRFLCPLCPSNAKTFRKMTALNMHLNSSKHAPKVFHCPSSLFPPSKDTKHHGPAKNFSNLSALAHHLESGACRGGKATLQKAMMLLEQRLKDLGFGQVRLLN